MKKNIQLIIPLSGIGKRFVESGYKEPKPLIEVDGKSIIEHVVNLFPGIDDISFICNNKHLQETNMRDILLKIKPNCKIYEVKVGEKKGPVDSVYSISEFLDDDKETIISYCDYGTVWNFERFIHEARDKNIDGSIPCYIGFHPHMLGSDNYAFIKQENKFLIEIREKQPFTENKMGEYASNGTYYFKKGSYIKKYFKELMDLDYNVKGEYYVSLIYNLMVRDNMKISIFEIDKMLQWGTPYDLEIYKQWSKYFYDKKNNPLKIIECPKNTTLLLPMAGGGTRFLKDGFELPKPLIKVENKSMVVQAVDCLPKCENIVFGCLEEHLENYPLKEELKNSFNNSNIIKINEITQGQACTCEIMINKSNIDLEKPLLISACDNGIYYDENKLKNLFDDENNDIIVFSFRNHQTSKQNPNMYAWLNVDENNFIKHVSCKKFIYEDPLKTHVIIGTMFFRKGKYFFDGLSKNYKENIRTNNEFYVDDVLNQNIKEGLKVKVFEVKNYICWGTPEDYKTYNYWNEYFLNK